jgi:hypothetical protein
LLKDKLNPSTVMILKQLMQLTDQLQGPFLTSDKKNRSKSSSIPKAIGFKSRKTSLELAVDMKTTTFVKIWLSPAGGDLLELAHFGKAAEWKPKKIKGEKSAALETVAPTLSADRPAYILKIDPSKIKDFITWYCREPTRQIPSHTSHPTANGVDQIERRNHPPDFGSEVAVDDESVEDIASIFTDPAIDPTTRKQLVAARIGQGQFRKNVIKVWGKGEQCIVTGTSLKDVLIASHIKPWKLSLTDERLAGWNGLLLVSHLDKLFDRFLISFNQMGGIISSRRLVAHWDSLKPLGINMALALDFSRVDEKSRTQIQTMLREHRAEVEHHDQLVGLA